MLKNDLDVKIVSALERIAQAHRVLLWNQGKKKGLSPLQLQILLQLHAHPHGQAKVSMLAETFDVSKPTISDAVKSLMEKKLILKKTSATDERSYGIFLSAKGQQLAEECQHYNMEMRESLTSISKEEKDDLFSNLSKIIRGMHSAGIISVQRMCLQCKHYRSPYQSHDHFCDLLNQPLLTHELRIDCPEFESLITENIM